MPQPLLHAVRVRLDVVRRPVAQADEIQDLADTLAARSPAQRTDNFEVPESRKIQIEVGLFDDAPNRPKRFLPLRFDRVAEEKNVALRGFDEGQQHADGCALPRAVRTEESEDVASMDIEV